MDLGGAGWNWARSVNFSMFCTSTRWWGHSAVSCGKPAAGNVWIFVNSSLPCGVPGCTIDAMGRLSLYGLWRMEDVPIPVGGGMRRTSPRLLRYSAVL